MPIIDNYLDDESFYRIQKILLSEQIPWTYHNYTDDSGDESNNHFYFGHMFYDWGFPKSPLIEILTPLLVKLAPISIHNIRANLMTRTDEHVESNYHADMQKLVLREDQLSNWTTSVFYINDNNGYTLLKDGTEIKSKSNRLLTIPGDLKHLGASCTDEKRRVVININYYALRSTKTGDKNEPNSNKSIP